MPESGEIPTGAPEEEVAKATQAAGKAEGVGQVGVTPSTEFRSTPVDVGGALLGKDAVADSRNAGNTEAEETKVEADSRSEQREAAESQESVAEKCGKAIDGKFERYHADPELKREIKKGLPDDPNMEGITLRHERPFRDPISRTINPNGYVEQIWRDGSGDSRWTYYENSFSNPTDNGLGGATNGSSSEIILKREKDGTLQYSRIRNGAVTKKIDYATADIDDKALVDSLMTTVITRSA